MLEAPTIPRAEPPRPNAEQLLETARLAAVGAMAGEVVHELNNPLFAILGLVEMLLRDAEPGSKAEHRLALVQQTGLEMRQLVRSFGDFARGTDAFVAPDLAAVVAQAVDLTRRTSATRDVDVVVHAAPESLPVSSDGAPLVAVVFDLITRARRALPAGGTVAVSLSHAGDSAAIHISVRGEQIAPIAPAGLAADTAAIEAVGGTLTHGPAFEFFVHLPLNHEETAS